MLRVAAAVLAMFLGGAAAAESAPPGDGSPPPTPDGSPPPSAAVPAAPGAQGTSWFALPFVFWLPETHLGFAAAGGLQLHVDGARRASSLFLVGAYTTNSQGMADLAVELALPGGTILSARARAVHFPDEFYGIGPRTAVSAGEPYTRRWSQGTLGWELPSLGGRLRAGPRVDLRAEEISDVRPGGLLAAGVEGVGGFTAVGVGGSAAYDTRDVPLSPRRGAFVEVWALHYPESLGRRHREFSAASLEGRVFHPAGPAVLAAAAYVEQAFGYPPFTILPKLGSSGYLRGWREGRFRDDLAAAAQVEARLPLAGRLGAAFFASAGEVARDPSALRLDTLRVGAGAGLRFRLTREGAVIRLDVAESAPGPEVYLVLLQAF